MNQLYRVVGISKQAISQYSQRRSVFNSRVQTLLADAELLREEHPGCGVEKMYYTLAPDFLGRDRFIELFMGLGFRIGKKKNYRRTTYASTTNHPNLIKGMFVDRPSMIWQSDITYIQAGNRFYYAVFIIDVYTRKIVGYQLSDHMRASANILALKMALRTNKAPDIHHSDRGSQYGYKPYLELLREKGSRISMSQSAQDNAYAERINHTIKGEYLDYWKPKTYSALKICVSKAVKNYNNKRIHNSIKREVPENLNKDFNENRMVKVKGFTIFDNTKTQ